MTGSARSWKLGPADTRCRIGMSYGPRLLMAVEGLDNNEIATAWTPAARSSPSASASSPSGSAALRSAHGEDDPKPLPPELAIEVKALACELPSPHGLQLSRLQVSGLAG